MEVNSSEWRSAKKRSLKRKGIGLGLKSWRMPILKKREMQRSYTRV